MGKDLHYTIVSFFEKVVSGHTMVRELVRLPNKEHYIYEIKRTKGLSCVIVVLSDEYAYGEFDYLNRPDELKDGGIILVAKPEAYFSNETQVNHPSDKILIGKIGILLGALNKEDFWNYEKPINKKDKK